VGDCASKRCVGGTCAKPSCKDKVKNGQETDVDCGAPACSKCADGKACKVNSHCQSGSCKGGVCAKAPCTGCLSAGVCKGGFTVTACGAGGAACKSCVTPPNSCKVGSCVAGKCNTANAPGTTSCTTGGKAGKCSGGVCVPTPTCLDKQKNGDETDVDCGGATCGPCANGKVCKGAGDCSSGNCLGGKCAAPCSGCVQSGTCYPGTTNNQCGKGGAPCTSCGVGNTCNAGVCSNCKHPTVTKSCKTDGTLGITFCTVPAGCYWRGSPTSEKCRGSDESRHPVTLTRNIEVMQTEVTQAMYQARAGSNPSSNKICGTACPVETITWFRAAEYCNMLSAAKGLAKCYTCSTILGIFNCTEVSAYQASGVYKCPGYRLPTASEFEYATRAGTTTSYQSGAGTTCTGVESVLNPHAWYKANSGAQINGAGQKTANGWGLYDMHGNVQEWCEDGYVANLGTSPLTDPYHFTVNDPARIQRGGSYIDDPKYVRAATRMVKSPFNSYANVGFRCVRTLNP